MLYVDRQTDRETRGLTCYFYLWDGYTTAHLASEQRPEARGGGGSGETGSGGRGGNYFCVCSLFFGEGCSCVIRETTQRVVCGLGRAFLYLSIYLSALRRWLHSGGLSYLQLDAGQL